MTRPLRILLLGGSGQLGSELRSTLAPLGTVIAPTRGTLDCARLAVVDAFIAAERPDVVVNAAGYTRVDDAERDRAAAEQLNGALPGQLAFTCTRVGVNLVHYSTDYVFSGAQRTPYREADATGPVNWYGVTKSSPASGLSWVDAIAPWCCARAGSTGTPAPTSRGPSCDSPASATNCASWTTSWAARPGRARSRSLRRRWCRSSGLTTQRGARVTACGT